MAVPGEFRPISRPRRFARKPRPALGAGLATPPQGPTALGAGLVTPPKGLTALGAGLVTPPRGPTEGLLPRWHLRTP